MARQYLWYLIVGVISFVSLVFLPMLGTEVGLEWHVPSTGAGWAVWIAGKGLVALINILLFHSFMQQGKLNIREEASYKAAIDLLGESHIHTKDPRSPEKWLKQQYGLKGTSIAIATALSTIALSNAVLRFDYASLITYITVITLGIIFGVIQMKATEEYWTCEYYDYVKELVKNVQDKREDLS